MNRVKIKLNGKELTAVFGTWGEGQVYKTLGDKGSPTDMLAYLFYFALIQGEGLRAKFVAGSKLPFDEFVFYDWADENGGFNGEAVQEVLSLINDNKSTTLPTEKK